MVKAGLLKFNSLSLNEEDLRKNLLNYLKMAIINYNFSQRLIYFEKGWEGIPS